MASPFNILISSAGRRVVLLDCFEQALAKLGLDGTVHVADVSKTSAAFHRARAAHTVPRCTRPEFVPAMLELCQRERIALVIPTIDTELPIYAAAQQEFTQIGTTVAVSSAEAIAITNDKRNTHAWLLSHKLPTVAQFEASQMPTVPSSAYPLIAKPAFGSSSIGLQVLNDDSDKERWARRNDYVFQEVARGVEHTIDVWIDNQGRARCAVPRQRIEVRAGEVSKGVTRRIETLQRLAIEVCESLPRSRGVLNVQIFWDEATRTAKIIEINARYGGGFPLAWQAGADYPTWMIEDQLGLPSTCRGDTWRANLLMLRYDASVFVEAVDAGL